MNGHTEDRRIAQLPSLRGRYRFEHGLHLETLVLVMPPPTSEAGQLFIVMALVHESAGDAARAAVQILVAAPTGEVHVPVVHGELQIASGVCEIEADDGARTMSRF